MVCSSIPGQSGSYEKCRRSNDECVTWGKGRRSITMAVFVLHEILVLNTKCVNASVDEARLATANNKVHYILQSMNSSANGCRLVVTTLVA